MSVRLKLLVLVVFVALVPISVSAWNSLRIHQRAFEQNLTNLHKVIASQEAQRVSLRLKTLQDNLQRLATGTVSWNELSEDERQAALWLMYRTDEDIVVVLLLDANRRLLTRPAYLTNTTADGEIGHLAASDSIVADLLTHLPQSSVAAAAPFGEPFLISADQQAILPISIPLQISKSAQLVWTLGVGVSVRALCKHDPSPTGLELLVVDSARRSLCATARFVPPLATATQRGYPPDSAASEVTYTGQDGQAILSTIAPLPHGWHVVAQQPAESAYAASRSMRRHATLWILVSMAIALASGLTLSRGISDPVRRLVAGVQELTRGNLTFRFESFERDEFGRLSQAFNDMAAGLAARDAEIRGWNAELQERVRERTLAIEQYHQYLLQAEKSAAVARLTAGVAAEVNDPLTGILGAVQLLATRARTEPQRAQEARLLANAEEGALRIRGLIKRVQALGQRQPRSQLRPVAVEDLLASALGLLGQTLAEANVQVVRLSAGEIPQVLGNFTQLEQALFQVLTNAVAACCASNAQVDDTSVVDRPQKRILVQTRLAQRQMVSISVSDDGVGVPEHELENIFEPFVTLRADSGAGLGLTIARRIVEEHGGKLWAESNEIAGLTLWVHLPAAERAGS